MPSPIPKMTAPTQPIAIVRLARDQAEWEPVSRPDCAPGLNASAPPDAKPVPTFAGGAPYDRSEFYNTIDAYIPRLEKGDYEVDEKQRTVTLTEGGMEKMEQMLRGANLLWVRFFLLVAVALILAVVLMAAFCVAWVWWQQKDEESR